MVAIMVIWQLVRRLIPALIMAGLILPPFAVPTTANAMSDVAMAALARDMSNCPSEQPAAPDCQKICPLMTVCAVNWLAGAPLFPTSSPAFGVIGNVIRPSSDSLVVSLAEGPPARPPRT